jgi:hypothetical protein
MFNRSKHMIAAGLALAIGALGNAGFKAQRFETHAERRARRGKPIVSRFFWGGSRQFCPPGGGAQEVARRRSQIEAGTLMTTEGQERLRELRAGRPWFYGVDKGPDGDCTVEGFVDENGHLHVTDVRYSQQDPVPQ